MDPQLRSIMDSLAQVAFLAYGLIILFGAVVAVASKGLVRALLGLILTLFGVAGMYMLLAAPFMALMQILIYLGAVVVLIFFAIMLTRAPAGSEAGEPRPRRQVVLAAASGLVPFFALMGALVLGMPRGRLIPREVDLAVIGQAFLGPYVLAFELISVVLFAAMAGAVLLGFERRRGR